MVFIVWIYYQTNLPSSTHLSWVSRLNLKCWSLLRIIFQTDRAFGYGIRARLIWRVALHFVALESLRRKRHWPMQRFQSLHYLMHSITKTTLALPRKSPTRYILACCSIRAILPVNAVICNVYLLLSGSFQRDKPLSLLVWHPLFTKQYFESLVRWTYPQVPRSVSRS